ncbi:MAG: hypothetical protein ACM3QZ_09755 [Solirubrobacterales bacterium]
MKNSRYYPYERNRYFYGKLLTVRDFELEQKYVNDKRRLLNRLLYGAGVVCGLQVVAVDEKTISIESGVALDYAGREIVVPSPITTKLSMLEGFSNNEYAKNVYLLIAYDEKEKEPVYSVTGSSARAEERSEYNRVQESYKLLVSEEPPDPSLIGLSALTDDIRLLYQDDQIKIWQKTPRFISRGQTLEVTLMVEKALQVPRIEVSYELQSEQFVNPDGTHGLAVRFSEPEHGQTGFYAPVFGFMTSEEAETPGRVSIKPGSFRLKIGDRELTPTIECQNAVRIVDGTVDSETLQTFYDLTLDQATASLNPEQGIFLARISLLKIGASYVIEKVENVPFGEYCFNASNLYRMGLFGSHETGSPDLSFSARAAITRLAAEADPQLSVTYSPKSQQFDFNLGLPLEKKLFEAVQTGVITVPIEAGSRSGKICFTEEIDHGLGLGPVCIVTAIEAVKDTTAQALSQHDQQMFFGDIAVFQKEPFEFAAPDVSLGVVAYPLRGTFKIGARLLASKVSPVQVRWWAYRQEKGSAE